MPRTRHRHLSLLAAIVGALLAIVLLGPSTTVWAHNTLLSSDPAEGAVFSVAPTRVTWQFDKAVPLETLTVTLIDVTGARSELSGSSHGPSGDTEVVTPLPSLQPGAVSLRWRLVGPDGHPISGRVDFSVTAAVPTSVPTSVPDAAPATGPAAVGPATSSPLGATPAALDAVGASDDTSSTPTALRWILRYGSYLAIMAIVGILLTSAFVWSAASAHVLLRRALSQALVATGLLGFVQLLVVASDVRGESPWTSFGAIDAALVTDAGMALMIRILLVVSLWLVLFRTETKHPDVYWTAVALPALGLLATWAFAGHSRSLRWPAVGVGTDVVHHGAAALWIVGLAIVGWIVIPTTPTDLLVPVVRRFSRVAAWCVAALVLTGAIQTVRLVGNPLDLLEANHGRLLAAKIVALAAMLIVANANRTRVEHRLDDEAMIDGHVGAVRTAVLTEFAIGLVIVAITAAMVVSPPTISETSAGAPLDVAAAIYYIV